MALVAIFASLCNDKEPSNESNETETTVTTHDYSLEANIDTILKLRKTTWKKLDQAQRLEVLYAIADYELVTYHGCIMHDYTIKISSISDKGITGSCNYSTKTITIDTARLQGDDSRKALSTLLHELTHLVQNRYAEIYESLSEEDKQLALFKDAATYSYELNNYISAGNNGYSSQLCEIEAKECAKQRTDYYFSLIDEYSKKTGKNKSKK